MPILLSFDRYHLAAKLDLEACLHHKPGVLKLPLGVRIGILKLASLQIVLGAFGLGKLTS